MEDIIARIDAHLAECAAARCQDEEPDREPILRECRDEIIAARACAEIMLQGTGQRLAESMAERVINGQTVGAWIPVSERLPGEYERVIGWRPGSARASEVWRTTRGDWLCGDCEPAGGIAHWMPLPEPPAMKSSVSDVISHAEPMGQGHASGQIPGCLVDHDPYRPEPPDATK